MDVTDFEPLTRVACPVCGEVLQVGQFIGEYELIEVMGRGGMGVVYRARDTQLDRPVALKLLRTDHGKDGFLSELESEAAVTASINHPHVVKVFTTGLAQGRFYLAMELVDKGTLDDLLALQGRVAESQALEIGVQIAQGLRAAHQHGLIHRDVKPGNILFADSHTAKIVDFGLAIMEQASKGSNEIWGTPYYVSPERLDQKAEDFRSDMYSLGATLFHIIAGRPPFEAEDATMVALKHLKSQAVSLQAFAPWVSGSTAYVINRTLLKDPAARYPSYDEFIEHLEYARAELTKQGSQPQGKKRVVLETAEDRRREGFLTTVMIAIVALALLGGGVWFFIARSHQKEGGLTASQASVGAVPQLAQSYEEARQLMRQGKAAAAADRFQVLAGDKKATEPFAQWCLAQEGIAFLAAGQLAKAQEAFTTLRARPVNGKDDPSRALSAFFNQVATIGAGSDAVTSISLKDVDASSYGALLLLVGGLKDWELGNLEEGEALLGRFLSSAPGGAYAWLTEYRALVSDYFTDLKTYQDAIAATKEAKSPEALQTAVSLLREKRNALKRTQGLIATRLEEAASKAASERGTLLREVEMKLEVEKKALVAARNKAAGLAKEWKFKEARAEVAPVILNNADLAREQRALLRKLDWLAAFKAKLIHDLAAGYKGNVGLKAGGELSSAVTKGTETGVEMVGEPAPPPRKWTELNPESVLAMAQSFIPADAQPAQVAWPRWQAGVFAAFIGRKEEAKKLLTDAAKANSELADQLALFMPPKRQNVALGRAKFATSNDATQQPEAQDGPGKAFDGDANTRWFLATPGQKWLRVDLGQNMNIVGWVVKHASSHGELPESDTADFNLQRSGDDKAWADVDRVRANTMGTTVRRVQQFNARYVRVTIDKPNRRGGNDTTARIYEVELTGTLTQPDLVGDFFAAPVVAPVPDLAEHDISIGGNEPSGATTVDERAGTFAIRSAGADIGTNYDAFRFAHRGLWGDGEVVVRVDNVDRGNDSSKAGVMFREGYAGDARMVFLGAHPSGHGVTWHARLEPKAQASSSHEGSISMPCWLKIERKGNTFTGSASKDGRTWKQIGSETLTVPVTLEAGMAVTGRSANLPNPAVKEGITTARMEVLVFGTGR